MMNNTYNTINAETLNAYERITADIENMVKTLEKERNRIAEEIDDYPETHDLDISENWEVYNNMTEELRAVNNAIEHWTRASWCLIRM